MVYVVFDPETGTVVDASNALLVDIDVLNQQMDTDDSDVSLSEEDADTQSLAQEIGVPVIQNATFIVACTGGVEDPYFEPHATQGTAETRFKEFQADMLTQAGDCVHLLKVANGTITILAEDSYSFGD